MDNLLLSLPTFFAAFVITAKMATIMFNSTEVKILLNQVEGYWGTISTDAEVDILHRHAENGRKLVKAYTVCFFVSMIGLLLMPLGPPLLDILIPLNDSRPRMVIYPAYYLVDQQQFYYSILINEYIASIACIIITVACDALYIMLVEHTCIMFMLLSYRLKHIIPNDKRALDDTCIELQSEQTVCRCVIESINLHRLTKQFTQLTSIVFGAFLAVDIGVGILMLSTSCVMIVFRIDRPSEIGLFLSITIAQCVRLFFNSWCGQKLMDCSTCVSTAAIIFQAAKEKPLQQYQDVSTRDEKQSPA